MTQTLTTTTADQSATIGPGRLVLVVGPSGAGKDTLLGVAKAACADDRTVVFPRRVITREASASEDNDEVSIGTFQEALARGDYAMHWEAHGHCYALSRAMEDEIRSGRTIIANVSRTVIGAARRAYADVLDAWRTSCPRLTVWEDAIDRGLVMRKPVAGEQRTRVEVTEAGERFLREHHRAI